MFRGSKLAETRSAFVKSWKVEFPMSAESSESGMRTRSSENRRRVLCEITTQRTSSRYISIIYVNLIMQTKVDYVSIRHLFDWYGQNMTDS